MEQTRRSRESASNEAQGSPSLLGLVDRLLGQVMELLDQKLSLFKLELKDQLAMAARNGAILAIGGVVAALGVLLLFAALALWVGMVIGSLPGGFAIVGGMLALGGGIVSLAMRRRLSQQHFVPEQSVQELRKDAEWIREDL